MTYKQMVEELRRRGHQVEYKVRSDRGIRITRIDNQIFKASTSAGNKLASQMLGAQEKTRLNKQLAEYNRNRKKKRQLLPVSDEVRKEIRSIQAKFRKKGSEEGKPTLRQYRWNVEKYGEHEALKKLHHAERYIQDIAYMENLSAYIECLRTTASTASPKLREASLELMTIAEQLEANETRSLKQSDLNKLFERWYDMTNHEIKIEDWFNYSKRILQEALNNDNKNKEKKV